MTVLQTVREIPKREVRFFYLIEELICGEREPPLRLCLISNGTSALQPRSAVISIQLKLSSYYEIEKLSSNHWPLLDMFGWQMTGKSPSHPPNSFPREVFEVVLIAIIARSVQSCEGNWE